MDADANGAPMFQMAGHVIGELEMRDVDTPEGADLAMELPIKPTVTNPRGGLQGGLLATLIDVVAGRAAGRDLPEARTAATADMNIRFLSAITVGPARAVARVIRRGRSLVVVQVDVSDAGRDVLAAVATLSFAVLNVRPEHMAMTRESQQGRSVLREAR